MYDFKDSEIIDLRDLEIKVIPTATNIVVQISSSDITGCLVMMNDMDREEFSEITDMIFSMIEKYSLLNIDEDNPQ